MNVSYPPELWQAFLDDLEEEAQAYHADLRRSFQAARSSDSEESKTKGRYQFSSTQFDLPEDVAQKVRELGRRVSDEHLAEDGREENSHITLKYGLHTGDHADVARALRGAPPVRVTFGSLSLFPADESHNSDVLKVDVLGQGLHDLHKRLSKLTNSDTHSEYHPHVTVAYLKAGMGDRYVGKSGLEGRGVVCHSVTFSARDGSRHDIPLGDRKFNPEEPRDHTGEWTSGGASARSNDPIEREHFTGRGISVVDSHPDGRRALETIVGRQVSDDEVARLVGAPDGATVSIDKPPYPGKAQVSVNHPFFASVSIRWFGRKPWGDRGLEISNSGFYLKEDAPTGFGTHVFAHQVKAAVSGGFSCITTVGAAGPGLNGYYTWPRLGYVGRLSPIYQGQHSMEDLAQAHFQDPSIHDVSDLMTSPERRAWWKSQNQAIELEFDLHDGSQSRRVLDSYLQEKQYEVKYAPTQNRDYHGRWSPEGFPLDDKIEANHFTGNDVTVNSPNGLDRAREALQGMIEKPVTDADLARLVGAPDGSQIVIVLGGRWHGVGAAPSDAKTKIEVSVYNHLYAQKSTHQLYRDAGGNPVMDNGLLSLDPAAPSDLGTHVFAHQVRQAADLAIDHINTVATRGEDQNGYYTWARLGFDAHLPSPYKEQAQNLFGSSCRRVSDLMRTPKGCDWWRENGGSIPMSFDTHHDSASRQVFDSYLHQRSYNSKTTDFLGEMHQYPHTEDTGDGSTLKKKFLGPPEDLPHVVVVAPIPKPTLSSEEQEHRSRAYKVVRGAIGGGVDSGDQAHMVGTLLISEATRRTAPSSGGAGLGIDAAYAELTALLREHQTFGGGISADVPSEWVQELGAAAQAIPSTWLALLREHQPLQVQPSGDSTSFYSPGLHALMVGEAAPLEGILTAIIALDPDLGRLLSAYALQQGLGLDSLQEEFTQLLSFLFLPVSGSNPDSDPHLLAFTTGVAAGHRPSPSVTKG